MVRHRGSLERGGPSAQRRVRAPRSKPLLRRVGQRALEEGHAAGRADGRPGPGCAGRSGRGSGREPSDGWIARRGVRDRAGDPADGLRLPVHRARRAAGLRGSDPPTGSSTTRHGAARTPPGFTGSVTASDEFRLLPRQERSSQTGNHGTTPPYGRELPPGRTRKGKGKVDSGSLFRAFRWIPWLIFDFSGAAIGCCWTESAVRICADLGCLGSKKFFDTRTPRT